MKSKFLEYFISDLADMDDVSPREAITKSKCLSADVNAAFDPKYSSNYDLNNSSYINRGVVLTKYTGSGGKYGTSDASAEYTGEILLVGINYDKETKQHSCKIERLAK